MSKPITKYELLPPGGQWMRWRFPSRRERFHRGASTAFALLVSLSLWALMIVAGWRWIAS